MHSVLRLVRHVPFLVLGFALPGGACPVIAPDREALVDVGLSTLDGEAEVSIHGEGEQARCNATLRVDAGKLPSRSQIPRPREIAGEVAPAARALGATICQVTVWFDDPLATASDEDDPDVCWTGAIRLDGHFWRTEIEDAPCW